MYFRHLVGVLEEFFAAMGAPWPALMRERRIGTPTVSIAADFANPAFHGETLRFAVVVEHVGRSSLRLRHEVSCDGRALWRARQTLVATSLETHRAIAWPGDLRAALLARREGDEL
jgi:4-hydroxybenzoyl-CoA thioesterase